MQAQRTRRMVRDFFDGEFRERVTVKLSNGGTNVTLVRRDGPGSDLAPWYWSAVNNGYNHGGCGTLREAFARIRRLFATDGRDPW